MSEDRLRRELEDSFRNRAHLYRLLHEELIAALGFKQGEAVMTRAIERLGRELGAAAYSQVAGDAQAAGDAFLAASSDGGRLYPTQVERRADGVDIRVERCPLKEAWLAANLPPDRVAALCRIAGAFDKGLFEAAGVSFSNKTWTAARGGGCCQISLRNRAAPHS